MLRCIVVRVGLKLLFVTLLSNGRKDGWGEIIFNEGERGGEEDDKVYV